MIRSLATVLLVGVLAAPAAAADLVLDTPPVDEVDVSLVNSVYFQVLGGAALSGSYEYSFGLELDLDVGYALAAAVGLVVMDGLSVELDVFHASRALEVNSDASIETTSLMGNLKYTAELNDMFSLYGAVGLGVIHAAEIEPGEVDSGSNFGYQLIAGASADVTENLALLAEVRYQNSFDGVELSDSGISIDVPTTAVLAGAKLAF